LEAQVTEFEDRWLEELSDASSLPLKSLKHGIRFYTAKYEGSYFRLNKDTSGITFQYMLEKYSFDVERCDEFEDIDIHDFRMRWMSLDKDELMKVNIVFAELECLIPYMVRWNRELEAL
jgi:hypothetical protein